MAHINKRKNTNGTHQYGEKHKWHTSIWEIGRAEMETGFSAGSPVLPAQLGDMCVCGYQQMCHREEYTIASLD